MKSHLDALRINARLSPWMVVLSAVLSASCSDMGFSFSTEREQDFSGRGVSAVPDRALEGNATRRGVGLPANASPSFGDEGALATSPEVDVDVLALEGLSTRDRDGTESQGDQGGEVATAAGKMIIRSGNATVEVDSIDAAIAAVHRIASDLGGVVGNSSLSAGSYTVRSAVVELRIPAPRFDEALERLNSVGKVELVRSNADDVGEEFVDVNARLANAKRLEERLLSLLATRGARLEDVLAVERELSRVREQIDRFEGRVRFLSSRVATSSLTVNMHERTSLVTREPGRNVFADAMRNAWRNFILLIAAFISSLGILIPGAAVAYLAYRWFPRSKK